MDGFGHGGPDQEIDRQTELNPVADIGSRDPQWEAAQLAAPEGIGKWFLRCSGAWDDDELGELGELFGVAPFGQFRGVIGADEVVEFGPRVATGVVTHGHDGKGDSSPADFLVVDGACGLPGEGEAQQAQPFVGRGEYGMGFKGGLRGGNEVEPIQGELFAGGLGHEEMPEVNWIEGTAVEADALHGSKIERTREPRR